MYRYFLWFLLKSGQILVIGKSKKIYLILVLLFFNFFFLAIYSHQRRKGCWCVVNNSKSLKNSSRINRFEQLNLFPIQNLTLSQFENWKIAREIWSCQKPFCWPCGLWIIDSAPERIARLWRLSSTLKTTFVCWVQDVFLATALNS
jgi:hypothetical protein